MWGGGGGVREMNETKMNGKWGVTWRIRDNTLYKPRALFSIKVPILQKVGTMCLFITGIFMFTASLKKWSNNLKMYICKKLTFF
jgi:hypothetical protein